ncbi:16S rRNA (guanine(527)-N(7))-methyltransferase RsmG [Sphingomonas sp. SM33]|uniref:Ribosomal RNA small subunit methyltransferase G n=1 Tax=Sphingomonas telluris TaxID=2907998 RepID=A0ABS9VPG9_9SPHN|nr:16S rRNA (guanine(527)-N(7))-methyltransferase RsmG [Sphingomonas telluris]MCH8616865.1 16S rRNA (guanine(527)-N(7))-methyltransferase RsmG [Sphingomonas telluris]
MIERLSAAAGRDVSRETFERLKAYANLLREGAAEQNLIALSTLDTLWERHILDSAQLARFEPFAGASWADVGSGAGLPGVVLALLTEGPITLIEPRRLRADFLQHTIEALGIAGRVEVKPTKVERVEGKFDVITARAVANMSKMLQLSQHLSTRKTVWALPKGRGALAELAEAQRAWQGVFHVEQSVTDVDSFIIVGTGVREKTR